MDPGPPTDPSNESSRTGAAPVIGAWTPMTMVRSHVLEFCPALEPGPPELLDESVGGLVVPVNPPDPPSGEGVGERVGLPLGSADPCEGPAPVTEAPGVSLSFASATARWWTLGYWPHAEHSTATTAAAHSGALIRTKEPPRSAPRVNHGARGTTGGR